MDFHEIGMKFIYNLKPNQSQCFRRFRKIAKKWLLASSCCLSVRMERLDPSRRIFNKSDREFFFPKYVEKIQVSLKSDKNNDYFAW